MEVERRENIIRFNMDENYLPVGGLGGTKMNETKPFSINRQWVMNAYLKVRSSNKAMKAMNEKMKGWRTERASDSKLIDVAKEINPFVRGWINYYGKFYTSKLKSFMHIVNIKLARWVRRKYKHLRPSEMKAIRWLAGICERSPSLFAHWHLGSKPTVG